MQGTRNGLSHRIVDQQTIAGANHNGQATQPIPGILGRHVRKQRLQQRQGYPTDDGHPFKHPPGNLIADILKKNLCEFVKGAL